MGSKITVVIAEDHEESQEILSTFIQASNVFEVVGIANDGEKLLDLNLDLRPDLIIADINMPKLDGVKAIEACLKINPALRFIFTTGYGQYAVKAFDLNALDYVMKPIKKERLYIALDKARTALVEKKQKNKIITIKVDRVSYFIHLDKVIFIERDKRKTIIHTEQQIYETNESLNNLVEQLNDNFFRTHRSFIVNKQYISYISFEGDTYFAHFINYPQYAHVSKLQKTDLMNELSNTI
ncbi:LytTR family DNA-binding domain-containing protein [Aquibacillus koreensis]|uniref:LytTR family DNA-binding domain-containing protein n=1 Tax=Aquibacillus koreensis TaxID=279446 RepID=A0A9X4AJI9_9BACI|nr:LytTR family DNA-binding domain-containing protein [Aquibacillus koreensis]MCT2535467.1 LytTR family DNA-binding domain-containing protein [Aquibacillus koreensis]MDC3422302.1 LytTR family DNA-binding domain-containing protein [Aquibacillus koreensis]